MNLVYFIKKNAPTILSIAASVGVVLTAVSSAQAAVRARNVVVSSEREPDPLIYLPPVIMGAGTIACIMGANVLNRHSQAALLSAYQLLDASYKQYIEHSKLIFGDDAEKKINNSIAREQVHNAVLESEDTTLFYDMYTKRYFNSTMAKVYKAEYEINRIYSKFGYVCLQEFYDGLGIDCDDYYYDGVGWSKEAADAAYGYECIDIEHEHCVLEDGLQCCIIWYPYPPTTDFLYY